MLQGKALCGVCALTSLPHDGAARIFAGINYGSALAALRVAAARLGLERASEWGTHCFRRGWADKALVAGGPTALFYSGSWRGVAAWGYASARAQGTVGAAEWVVDFSDSSADEA